MRSSLTSLIVALLLISGSAFAEKPHTAAQQNIEHILSREPMRSGSCGVFAITAAGDTLVDINSRVKLVPASNLKLITTGLALKILGEDYRFETSLAYSGKIEDGILEGDLYIIGGADPSTGSKADFARSASSLFAEWTSFVRDAGIKSIEGRIIGDPRFFPDPQPENPGWSFDDIGTYYGVGPVGLNFYENEQTFYVTPGAIVGSRPSVYPRYPETPWMNYVNAATTSAPRSANTLNYIPSYFGPDGGIVGQFPVDRKGYTLECSNHYGAFTCAYHFFCHLKNAGIKVSGGFGDVSPLGYIRTDLQRNDAVPAPKSSELNVIGVSRSEPLPVIVGHTNRESDNFFAETLMRMIGRKVSGKSDYNSSTKAVEDELKALGLRTSGNCQIVDGSGLSRKNYISPVFFVYFLKAMSSQSFFRTFFDSLPVPGHEGTLKDRFSRLPQAFKDRIHMKSGSMDGVRCFSGYIQSPDGNPDHTIIFSVMTNNVVGSSWTANTIIDDIIESIAGEY